MKPMLRFLRCESGQDLTEYTLLVAFVALASAAIVLSVAPSITPIWLSANTQLSIAVAATSQPQPQQERQLRDGDRGD